MKKLRFILIISMLIALFACKNNDFSDLEKKIAKLNSKVDSLESKLNDTMPVVINLDSPLVKFDFNQDSIDLSGNGYDFKMHNGAKMVKPPDHSFWDYAVQFDGVDDYLELSKPLPDSRKITISYWQYSDDNSIIYGTIFCDATVDWGNDFFTVSSYNRIGIRADKGIGSYLNFEEDSPESLKGLKLYQEWNFVSFVIDGENLIVYLNGNKIYDEKIVGSNEGFHADHPIIGARNVYGKNDMFFKGMIDNFSIYDRALNQEEVRKLMKG